MGESVCITPAMARRIEIWPTDRLVPFAKNARTHSQEQVAQIAASIAEFGFVNPILVDSHDGIIAGHGRLLAARKLGLRECPVVVLDHLSETQRRAYIIADNKLAMNAGWDEATLAGELCELEGVGVDLGLVGFSEEELDDLLAGDEPEPGGDAEEEVPEPPASPVTRPGDLWQIGKHRLICGDCRDRGVVERLVGAERVNVAITSPPYATQREYDPSSGFKPIRPEEYVAWYEGVAANIEAVLAADGSFFLNIKEHADDGERSLYVKDLVIAHRRQWGWRFVDEFCWRKTDNGVPGGWNNRFKNAWRYAGVARPSNVVEVKSESSQGSHSAPFPRALVEFFLLAFSDAGDLIYDPFMGSGTTMAAAALLERVGCGCEISPAYCDVILRRMSSLTGGEPVLLETGDAFGEVAFARGVPIEPTLNPKQQDARAIKYSGPNPHYGPRRRKAS
jgi:DNA modification methylase